MPIHVGDRVIYENGTSNPGSPSEGDIYWNSTDNVYKYYDGSSWQTVANEGVGESPAFAASNAAQIYATGNRTDGYYWIKGDGTRSARLMYCILNANWGGGGGWMVVANHDGQKEQHAGHQPRVTARTDQIGSDDGSGNPGQTSMVPEKSFSVDMVGVPYTKFMHVAYSSTNMSSVSTSNWLGTPLAYYYGAHNSSQTIPTTRSYRTADFDTSGSQISFSGGSGLGRRLSQAGSYTWLKGFGVGSNRDGSPDNTFKLHNGYASQTADYPVWVSYRDLVSGAGSYTFSFTDAYAAGQGASFSPNGWDDFQDGSGMGDDWEVEGVGDNGHRGAASMVVLQ